MEFYFRHPTLNVLLVSVDHGRVLYCCYRPSVSSFQFFCLSFPYTEVMQKSNVCSTAYRLLPPTPKIMSATCLQERTNQPASRTHPRRDAEPCCWVGCYWVLYLGLTAARSSCIISVLYDSCARSVRRFPINYVLSVLQHAARFPKLTSQLPSPYSATGICCKSRRDI